MIRQTPSGWISFGCLAVLAAGIYCIRDGLSGVLLPEWAIRWQIGWKPLSSGVRIFLGLILSYGSLLAFLKDYAWPAGSAAPILLLELIPLTLLWLAWPILLLAFPETALPLSIPVLAAFTALSLAAHGHMILMQRR